MEEEEEKKNEEDDKENTGSPETLKCRGCGCCFASGNGGVRMDPGYKDRGNGICWACVIRKQRKRRRSIKGWTPNMLDILQEEEDMLDKMEEDKENDNPQKRGEEKKHEDGPKGNYETPKTELENFGKLADAAMEEKQDNPRD